MNKRNRKELNLTQKLRSQADEKNSVDLKTILIELDEASLAGEYSRTIQLKINQVVYLQSIGLTVETSERFGFYKISW
jgi:hypothetical protein